MRVDVNGNKSWQTFTYNVPNAVENAPISKAEFDALVSRIATLEGKLIGDYAPKEVSNNVEPNG